MEGRETYDCRFDMLQFLASTVYNLGANLSATQAWSGTAKSIAESFTIDDDRGEHGFLPDPRLLFPSCLGGVDHPSAFVRLSPQHRGRLEVYLRTYKSWTTDVMTGYRPVIVSGECFELLIRNSPSVPWVGPGGNAAGTPDKKFIHEASRIHRAIVMGPVCAFRG